MSFNPNTSIIPSSHPSGHPSSRNHQSSHISSNPQHRRGVNFRSGNTLHINGDTSYTPLALLHNAGTQLSSDLLGKLSQDNGQAHPSSPDPPKAASARNPTEVERPRVLSKGKQLTIINMTPLGRQFIVQLTDTSPSLMQNHQACHSIANPTGSESSLHFLQWAEVIHHFLQSLTHTVAKHLPTAASPSSAVCRRRSVLRRLPYLHSHQAHSARSGAKFPTVTNNSWKPSSLPTVQPFKYQLLHHSTSI